ncbi:MAG: hypothetical protein AAF215_28190 [Cyanobacteria bacterium P01_A01_bin.123]
MSDSNIVDVGIINVQAETATIAKAEPDLILGNAANEAQYESL